MTAQGGDELADRHPATTGLLRWFEYDHLPDDLQAVSRPVGELAYAMVAELPDGPELTTGLRKLLEAKDCLVRAAIGARITRDRGPWVAPNARGGEIERVGSASSAEVDAYLKGETERGAGPDDEPADEGDEAGSGFVPVRGEVQR